MKRLAVLAVLGTGSLLVGVVPGVAQKKPAKPIIETFGFCNCWQFAQFSKAENQIRIPDQAELERGHHGTCGASIGINSKSGRL
jgi:hypothetical protein